MPPGELLFTISSQSNTNKPTATQGLTLDTPVQFLKGVGPRYGAILQNRGLNTLRDLLYYLPRDYQDRTKISPISALAADETALIQGQIIGFRMIPIRKLRRPMLEATLQDGTGRMSLKWFHYPAGFK